MRLLRAVRAAGAAGGDGGAGADHDLSGLRTGVPVGDGSGVGAAGAAV